MKYRCAMMRKEKIKVFCKVAIEEACKKHKIEIVIIKVLDEHVHLIVDYFGSVPNLEKDMLEEVFGTKDIFVRDAKQILIERLII